MSSTANVNAAIQVDETQAQRIALQIWQNEGAGRVDYLTVWNEGEDFPSFGIGHFIWYPTAVDGPFVESFPDLRDYLQQRLELPEWLRREEDSPWRSREQFYQQFDSAEMNGLRQLLQQSVSHQVGFIIQRMEQALPKMLEIVPEKAQRAHISTQFYRVADQANGPYALIDYINFKGEGVALSERYQGEGWGMLQVLQRMDPKASDVMAEFVHSADTVLTQRVANASRDESRWLVGWRKRLQTYLGPVNTNFKTALPPQTGQARHEE